MTTAQNHPVTLTLEPGNGYRVKAQYDIGRNEAVSIDVLVSLTDPTIWEAQAEACRLAAKQLRALEDHFRGKLNKQYMGQ